MLLRLLPVVSAADLTAAIVTVVATAYYSMVGGNVSPRYNAGTQALQAGMAFSRAHSRAPPAADGQLMLAAMW
jgi:hypothetical protein